MDSWANSGSRDLHLDLQGGHPARRPWLQGPAAHRPARRRSLRTARAGHAAATVAPSGHRPRIGPQHRGGGVCGIGRRGLARVSAGGGHMGGQHRHRTAARPARAVVRAVPSHNLMPGSPDVSDFPRSEWAASTRRALAAAPTEALRMGDPRGRPELREALAEYLARARGVRTSAESIVICAGVRHGVELLARVFGARGPIAVEAYGLFIFRDAIAATGHPDGADRHRRRRRGDQRPRRVAGACRAADPRPPQPDGYVAASIAAHRRRRVGAAHRRLRPRRRLRRGVPLRPPADRRAAGAVVPTGSSTWARQARACPRRCGWAGWWCRTA